MRRLPISTSLLLAALLGLGTCFQLQPQLQVQAEVGLGGGLGLYPLELAQLKAHFGELGMPPEALAAIPDTLPLPHLAVRLQLAGFQLTLFGLKYERLLDQDSGLRLSMASLAANLEAPVRFQFPLLRAALGLGVGLLSGEAGLTARDGALDSALEQMGLGRLTWAALDGHAMGELALALGPLRIYLLGRYLLPLMRLAQGLAPGDWELELGLGLSLAP